MTSFIQEMLSLINEAKTAGIAARKEVRWREEKEFNFGGIIPALRKPDRHACFGFYDVV